MLAFEVNDMTCGHCASTITKAVKTIDPGADVQVDLGRHLVSVATDANAGIVGSPRFQCNNWRYANPALARGWCW